MRNIYPAIQRELCKDASVREASDSIYGPSHAHAIAAVQQSMQDVQAQQSGHSRQMEEMIYGLLVTESPFATISEKEQFRKVSVNWHRVLHFPSSWEDEKVDPRLGIPPHQHRAVSHLARLQARERPRDTS